MPGEHDLLYAYGPLEEFESTLRRRDFRAGLPAPPDPHTHHYNDDELDSEEVRLREWGNWRRVLAFDDDERGVSHPPWRWPG